MTSFQQGIITLMKSAFTGSRGILPEDFSLEEAEVFARKQDITTLVFEGAVQCGISTKEPAMQRMLGQYVQLMLRSERQMADVQRLCKAFDENNIDYLLLKGCNMKKFYPKPELRYMGDADILIRVEQYDRIIPVMVQLGFAAGEENEYECHWTSASLHMELHKALIPPNSPDFLAYWGNGWDRGQKLSGSRYAFSSEDEFLFYFTHFAKHYRGPGIGCRYVLDLWVFLRAHPELDQVYLEQELARLGLLEFYNHVYTAMLVWFGNEPNTGEITDTITDYVFSGTSWGIWLQGQVAAAAKNTVPGKRNKVSVFLAKAFPPASKMVYSYPILKRAAFLLPVCWLHRILRALFIDKENRKKGMRIIQGVSDERIALYQNHMRKVGLYYDGDPE